MVVVGIVVFGVGGYLVGYLIGKLVGVFNIVKYELKMCSLFGMGGGMYKCVIFEVEVEMIKRDIMVKVV